MKMEYKPDSRKEALYDRAPVCSNTYVIKHMWP